MRKTSLAFVDEKAGTETLIKAEFTLDEFAVFETFLVKQARLADSAWIRSGMKSGMTMDLSQETGLTGSIDLPPWDDVIVVLHKFRPFGLQDEPTYFYKMSKVLARRVDNPEFRAYLDDAKDLFSGKRMQSKIRIDSGGLLLNSERVLNDWLNSYEYHQDADKKQIIDSIPQLLPDADFMQAIFCHLLTDRVRAVFGLGQAIQCLCAYVQPVETRP